MSGFIKGLTLALWAIPIGMFLSALRSPSPLMPLSLTLFFLYGAVWLWWRPARFDVSAEKLNVVFPSRRRSILRADIVRARVMTKQEFHQEFGRAIRIGAGGLWGGFGWLWTSRGLVDFYVSRSDGLVLIERRTARPILITPTKPEMMVEALG
jgi:hypothetical protein